MTSPETSNVLVRYEHACEGGRGYRPMRAVSDGPYVKYDDHRAEIERLQGELRTWKDNYQTLLDAKVPAPEPSADQYALTLLETLVNKFGRPDGWQPLPDLLGKLTQIDNVVAGLLARTSPPPFSSAACDVANERERQKAVEGWAPEHDDEHTGASLAQAAACYALGRRRLESIGGYRVDLWPWEDEAWKPKDARRNLVRAGALILAEIERIDRQGPTKGAGNG